MLDHVRQAAATRGDRSAAPGALLRGPCHGAALGLQGPQGHGLSQRGCGIRGTAASRSIAFRFSKSILCESVIPYTYVY